MSGHNRWSKIKRQKEAMGSTKGAAFSRISKEQKAKKAQKA